MKTVTQNMRAKNQLQYLGVGLSTVWLYAKQEKEDYTDKVKCTSNYLQKRRFRQIHS